MARQAHTHTLERVSQLTPKDQKLPARLHYRYAETLQILGDLTGAELQALEARNALSSLPEHDNLNLYLNNLIGRIKSEQGDFNAATDWFKRVLPHNNPENARNQAEQVAALMGLGIIHIKAKQYQQAEERLFQALDINTGLYGEQHKVTGKIRHHLGRLYLSQKLTTQARQQLQQAAGILSLALPAGHQDLLATHQLLTDFESTTN